HPGTAAVVCDPGSYRWQDQKWMASRRKTIPREAPMSIYEVHLPSWRRKPEEGHRPLTYAELANELVGYVAFMEFTHICLLPIGEYDDEASLGYQTFAPFAPTSRWGEPDDLRLLIDTCHQAGIGVILGWAPIQFSDDWNSLREFDGTHLYEPPDARRQLPGSKVFAYDYGRREVVNYLISNALYWLDLFHVDALHIDGLSRILYLDYGRARGEWEPNRFGGHENLEAVDFLRRFNEEVYARFPDVFTVCEEGSLWRRVSHPTFIGGLGFGFKWHTGWGRNALRHLSRNPVHRKYYHDEVTESPATIFNENHVLAVSHDEVSQGKGSLFRRMPGDHWQRFANLRLFFALLYTHPGKKLLFMGDEFAQEREWNPEISLDWHLAGHDGLHQGIQRLIRDLNALYRSTPALYEQDCDPNGFSWIDYSDSDQGILAFTRSAADGKGLAVVICHFTPVVRKGYRIGVPEPGIYQERLNTDSERYGGTNMGNYGAVSAEPEPAHGRLNSIGLTLAPYGVIVLEHIGRAIITFGISSVASHRVARLT
ncbi:MAG: 1,4-alpha-glucan branching protein GlgB, partial [Rhodospirillales bacterium]|nr:1,4-alpha-glucan branching protein GlgB [Rhodospirillales bacterium]